MDQEEITAEGIWANSITTVAVLSPSPAELGERLHSSVSRSDVFRFKPARMGSSKGTGAYASPGKVGSGLEDPLILNFFPWVIDPQLPTDQIAQIASGAI